MDLSQFSVKTNLNDKKSQAWINNDFWKKLAYNSDQPIEVEFLISGIEKKSELL